MYFWPTFSLCAVCDADWRQFLTISVSILSQYDTKSKRTVLLLLCLVRIGSW